MAFKVELGPAATAVAAFIATYILYIVYRIVQPSLVNKPFPPGPKGDPILGCLRHTPTIFPARFYKDVWGKQYGDLIFFRVLVMPTLVINNAEMATELLDKRGANNSDRPTFHYALIQGFRHTISFMRWGKRCQ